MQQQQKRSNVCTTGVPEEGRVWDWRNILKYNNGLKCFKLGKSIKSTASRSQRNFKRNPKKPTWRHRVTKEGSGREGLGLRSQTRGTEVTLSASMFLVSSLLEHCFHGNDARSLSQHLLCGLGWVSHLTSMGLSFLSHKQRLQEHTSKNHENHTTNEKQQLLDPAHTWQATHFLSHLVLFF